MIFTGANGKKTALLKGDVVQLKDGTTGTILRVNKDLAIANGTAVVQTDTGQKIITESDVNDIVRLVFSIIRLFKTFFQK
jgi:hypothetical protein